LERFQISWKGKHKYRGETGDDGMQDHQGDNNARGGLSLTIQIYYI
jgi:hypothetical protein